MIYTFIIFLSKFKTRFSFFSDNRLQAKTTIKITSKSKTEKCLLKLSIKILIKSLKNPNETWTNEKITLRVEEMIKNLHESNEINMLEKFVDKLNTDRKVLSNLVKCGVELYDMLLSIKKNLSATEVNITEGSVCITFYFAEKEDLENYLRKLSRHDEKFFKDLSKIILNKTFLEIFGVNYKLVQWTMSAVRAYRGLCFFPFVLFFFFLFYLVFQFVNQIIESITYC